MATLQEVRKMPVIERRIYPNGTAHVFRDGFEIVKGTTVNELQLERMEPVLQKYIRLWSVYPDLYIDLITPANSQFTLYFYQRLFLRACMRYRYVYVTAPRAFSKTFLAILALYLQCMFMPGKKVFICAPKKGQAVKIITEKFNEILDIFPLLRKELIGHDFQHSADYAKALFRNHSVFDVVVALDSQRGGRRHAGLIDEVREMVAHYKTF